VKLKLSAAAMSAIAFLALIGAFAVPSRGSGTSPSKTSSEEDDSLALIYVSGVSGGITEISSANNAVFGTAPWSHGSNGGIEITPDGSTHLDPHFRAALCSRLWPLRMPSVSQILGRGIVDLRSAAR
jgi:hypothetical protein